MEKKSLHCFNSLQQQGITQTDEKLGEFSLNFPIFTEYNIRQRLLTYCISHLCIAEGSQGSSGELGDEGN